LKLPLIEPMPERAISLWVLSSGRMSLSPAVRLTSSTVAATVFSAAAAGGVVGGAGVAATAGADGAAAGGDGAGALGTGGSGGATGAGVTAGLCSGAGALGGGADDGASVLVTSAGGDVVSLTFALDECLGGEDEDDDGAACRVGGDGSGLAGAAGSVVAG